MGMNNSSVSDILGISMEKIKQMADVNAIIGEPIKLDDGTTIIPISKVSYGFASGGFGRSRSRNGPMRAASENTSSA